MNIMPRVIINYTIFNIQNNLSSRFHVFNHFRKILELRKNLQSNDQIKIRSNWKNLILHGKL